MTAQAETTSGEIDEGRLREMLALVGPASESRLLRSLIGDLRAARAALARAGVQHDTDLLRSQAHVLASLAATFGAFPLNAAVRELEANSRLGEAETDVSGVLRRTERLIAELSARLAGRPR